MGAGLDGKQAQRAREAHLLTMHRPIRFSPV
jgi:hypothetical protein